MDLFAYNWLKKAMAGQLSMESYARTVKDKDHQMMIVHGDKHIGKEAGVVLAAENPYIHQEVQDYIYDITKPYVKSQHNYSYVESKSKTDLDLLYALVKNPSLSADTASNIISGFSSFLKEIEKVGSIELKKEVFRFATQYFRPVFLGLATSKALNSSSFSEFISIFFKFESTMAHFDNYERSHYVNFPNFIDSVLSELVKNTSIEKSERLKVASSYFNPNVVGSFIKSEDTDSNDTIDLIVKASSDIKDKKDYEKLGNYIKTVISIINSYNPENENFKKLHSLFISNPFFDHFMEVIDKYNSSAVSYSTNGMHRFQFNQDEEFLASIANKVFSEEEKLFLLKKLDSIKNPLHYHKNAQIYYNTCEKLLSTGRVSEEFIDLLHQRMNSENFWSLLYRHPESTVHIFHEIYIKYKEDYSPYDMPRWIQNCIKIGISCESQKILVDKFLEDTKKSLSYVIGSYFFEDRFKELLMSNINNNYGYLILKSGHACPEIIKNLMSFGDGRGRRYYISNRLRDVKIKLSNLKSTV